MEREAANAKWQALHEDAQWHNGTWTSWAEKRSDTHPYHRDHGVTIGVALSDLRPDDDFLEVTNCGPPEGLAAVNTEPDVTAEDDDYAD